jgi:hypothetical protein
MDLGKTAEDLKDKWQKAREVELGLAQERAQDRQQVKERLEGLQLTTPT